MSATENRTKAIIGPTLEDLTFQLDRQWQTLLSNWTLKTAMVMDSIKNPEANTRYYQRADCLAFRQRRTIPELTRIWIGRSSLAGLGAYGTDVTIVSPDSTKRIGNGTATTIIVGHLAVQVFAFRVSVEYTGPSVAAPVPKPGDWDNMLAQIWPIERNSVTWAPKKTFTNSGARSIAVLMDRWRIGLPAASIKQLP